jgi:lysophospholipase L1-like esterase
MLRPRRSLFGLAAVAIFLAFASPTLAQFPLKDGDIWVMAGDSITAQHLHSNYFEAFCYARYPKLKFGFRNSGVGGHTIPSTLARFDYDIAAWKPTVVSVELGMNDQGGTPTDKFITNMDTMVKRIRAIGARPVILSASPINNGNMLATLSGTNGNKRLHEYAAALKDFCAKRDIPYADQFHALLDVWGKNKKYEAIGTIKQLAANDDLAGVEHLRAFLAEQAKNPVKTVSMQGDAVHPGAPGQLMMAAALLKELGADPFVSSATIHVAGKKAFEARNCVIDSLTVTDGKIAFDRLDERLPFPIPEEARAIVAFDPTILAMSQYTLKVTGLAAGKYNLSLNGASLGTVSSKALEAGVNLTAFGPGTAKAPNPITAQSKAILGAVSARAGLVGQWRGMSKAAHAPKAPADALTNLATMTKRVEEADDRIRAAAVPQKLHVELTLLP